MRTLITVLATLPLAFVVAGATPGSVAAHQSPYGIAEPVPSRAEVHQVVLDREIGRAHV